MIRIVTIGAAVLLATPVLAHPKLVVANPAANATVAAPARIQLRFNEKLIPRLSGATLAMTGMGGVSHAPMPVPSTTLTTADTLVVTTEKPLIAGTYRVEWHVVSADTHRVTGDYAFTVR